MEFTINIPLFGELSADKVKESFSGKTENYKILCDSIYSTRDNPEQKILVLSLSTKYSHLSKVISDFEGICSHLKLEYIPLVGHNFKVLTYRVNYTGKRKEFEQITFIHCLSE